MCTVTFLPLNNNNFILTSNRDEQRLRETLPPNSYIENEVKMVFPKDKEAGGTWIGASSNNRLVCVLNGAFVKHKRKEKYRKSRGVIAKEMLQVTTLKEYIKNLNLDEIEPFTMVILDWNENQLKLYELIWDGEKKHFKKLKNKPKIWSSSTLYKEAVKEIRKNWFKDWIANNKFTSQAILAFHHSEIGDKEQAVFMKRKYVETVSITSIKKEDTSVEMLYEDVVHDKKQVLHFSQ
jgi:uncharacterized protein with NRDE domain